MNVTDALNKWKPLIDNQNLECFNTTDDQLSGFTNNSTPTQLDTYNLLPLSIKIAAKTIGLNLVTVCPMDSWYETDEQKAERIRQEREDKMNDILDIEPIIREKTPYNGYPTVTIMYTDFIYETEEEKAAKAASHLRKERLEKMNDIL